MKKYTTFLVGLMSLVIVSCGNDNPNGSSSKESRNAADTVGTAKNPDTLTGSYKGGDSAKRYDDSLKKVRDSADRK